MSDAQFSAFLAACRDELTGLQAQFQQRIQSSSDWFYNLSDCTLRIGGQSFQVTPIGTYSHEYGSWLWGWANEEFPLQAREASRHLQALYTLTGFRVFCDPGVEVSDCDAQDFSAMAIHCLGAIGVFRVPGAPTLFLAVHDATRQ